jgi:hypothetical protein
MSPSIGRWGVLYPFLRIPKGFNAETKGKKLTDIATYTKISLCSLWWYNAGDIAEKAELFC